MCFRQTGGQLAHGLRAGIAVCLRTDRRTDGQRIERSELKFEVTGLAVAATATQARVPRAVARIPVGRKNLVRAVKRRANHLPANRSSVAYIGCITGLLDSADGVFAPYRYSCGSVLPFGLIGQSLALSGSAITLVLAFGFVGEGHFNQASLEGRL